jgi:hypothetical protein
MVETACVNGATAAVAGNWRQFLQHVHLAVNYTPISPLFILFLSAAAMPAPLLNCHVGLIHPRPDRLLVLQAGSVVVSEREAVGAAFGGDLTPFRISSGVASSFFTVRLQLPHGRRSMGP